MNETNCIFCKIANGEILARLVAESEHAVAFHDIAPAQPVHVLIIPREHHANVSDLAFANPAALVDLMQLASKIAAENTNGAFRFTFNTGAEAGQTVFHAHGHILSKQPKGSID